MRSSALNGSRRNLKDHNRTLVRNFRLARRIMKEREFNVLYATGFIESLIEQVGVRPLETAFGTFTAHAFRDTTTKNVHLALVRGTWKDGESVAVRVHEPFSVLDALEIGRTLHSWSLDTALAHIAKEGRGVVVLLNCGEHRLKWLFLWWSEEFLCKYKLL